MITVDDDGLEQDDLEGLEGARVLESAHAIWLGSFIDAYLRPLLFWRSETLPKSEGGIRKTFSRNREIHSEEEFWRVKAKSVFRSISLKDFLLVDWFPRAPGVACSPVSEFFWEGFQGTTTEQDPVLGKYFTPDRKGSLVVHGGIGTIRLRPRRVDGKDSWYATALKGRLCHRGIPLLIPDKILRQSGVEWGDTVTLSGQIRFMQDAELVDVALNVHHVMPLIVFVDELKGAKVGNEISPIINPVVLFEHETVDTRYEYAYVNCGPSETEAAVEWLERYTKKFKGRIVTNFDEQKPAFANAPLSYQRLVTKRYERTIIQQVNGTITAKHIDQVIDKSFTNLGDIHMGHKIDVSGGAANINIDSTLTNVTQTIGSTTSLDAPQKAHLEQLVTDLTAELAKLKASHAEEKEAIETALKTAVAVASKPTAERKKSILQVSAKGLKDAAELVKDIAPTILSTADLIAKFIIGL